MKRKYVLIAIMLALWSIEIVAQSKAFDNVLKMRFEGSGVIRGSENVLGYFVFYEIGKAKQGKQNYLLTILDENLKEVDYAEVGAAYLNGNAGRVNGKVGRVVVDDLVFLDSIQNLTFSLRK